MVSGLETERFALRSLGIGESYRLTVRHWLPDPVIMSGVAPRVPVRNAVKWFFTMERPNGRTKFTHAIELCNSGQLIGLNQTRLLPPSSAAMTIALHDRLWWGKGVVPEVRTAIIDALFSAGDVDRIGGQVLARNHPAVFNYKSLGFSHVGTLHRAAQNAATGGPEDVLLFELLRENWRPGQAR